MSYAENNLVWIDLEMTGLSPEDDRIIEIATLVTDHKLNILAEGPELVVSQEDELLAAMDEWNTKQHSASGLIDRVRNQGVSESEAEQQTLAFLRQYVPSGASPMCGNSICQDRRFLYNYMPQLETFFHYRHIDVSTLKELAKRWAPNIADSVEKQSSHRAMDDIRDSIAELAYYREAMLKI